MILEKYIYIYIYINSLFYFSNQCIVSNYLHHLKSDKHRYLGNGYMAMYNSTMLTTVLLQRKYQLI